MKNGRVLIFVTIGVVALVLCIFAVLRLSPAGQFSTAIGAIQDCTKRKATVLCAQPIVRRLLDTHTGDEIMQALDESLRPDVCHYVGHVVGQQMYQKYQNVDSVLGECGNTCESACAHGAIGEAFAEELGFDDPNYDYEHLSADEIKKLGSKLCSSSQPCHGVGHTLFQAYKSILPALDECNEVAPKQWASFCISGVFMEYSDVLTAKSVRPFPEVTFPTQDQLPTLCTNQRTLQERRACFMFLPRIIRIVLGLEMDETTPIAIKMCESYSGDNRSACFAGIGATNSYTVTRNLPISTGVCTQLPNERDEAMCNLGVIAFDVESRPVNVFKYCAGQSTEALRGACYQGVFFKLYQRATVDIDATANTYCNAEPLCLKGAQDGALDSWTLIQNRFPE